MRLWLSFGAVGLAACSFEPTGLPSLGDDDDVPIDARVIDAPPGTIDAPSGCLDTDNDTICNEADRCPGNDDRNDMDGDATPDGCDQWNCGESPPSVTLPMTIGGGLRIDQVSISGGGAVEELGRNTTTVFAVKFAFADPDPGQIDQIELGVAGGIRLNCRRPTDEIGGWTLPIGFGTGGTHHVVSLTAQVAHESNCNSGPRDQGWADDAPSAPIIGIICVR